MAQMIRPKSSDGTSPGYGNLPDWQYGPNGLPVTSDDPNIENDVKMQATLDRRTSEDPRMTHEQRLDQRYGNYTYGSSPEYAADQAAALQGRGYEAQSKLAAYGTQAYDRGTDIYGRQTPQTDYSSVYATQGAQGDLHRKLQAYGDQGPGKSLAQASLDANTGRSLRQQLMMAGSGRGAGGAASAYRNAAQNQALIQGQANADASMLQAQEEDFWRGRQLQAYGMSGDVLQDLSGQQSSNAQFLTQAELEAQAQRDQASLGYSQLGLDATTQSYGTDLAYEQEARANFENELDANMAYEGNITNLAIGRMDLQNAREQREAERWNSEFGAMVGAVEGGASWLADASDERVKTDIEPTRLTAYGAPDRFAKLKANREQQQEQREDAQQEQKVDKIARRSYGALVSDEHSKERIRELEGKLAAYEGGPDLRPAKAYTYRYKNPKSPGAGEGRYVGPMAQDLEHLPGVVKEAPDGTKMVDGGRAAMVGLSAIGEQQKRLDRVETALAAYSDDPKRLEFEAQKYGMPMFGAGSGAPEEEEEESSWLDDLLGPNLGQHASDVAEEERRNELLKQYWRNPPREDVYL